MGSKSTKPLVDLQDFFRKCKCILVCCKGQLVINNSEIDGPQNEDPENSSEISTPPNENHEKSFKNEEQTKS